MVGPLHGPAAQSPGAGMQTRCCALAVVPHRARAPERQHKGPPAAAGHDATQHDLYSPSALGLEVAYTVDPRRFSAWARRYLTVAARPRAGTR